MTPIEAIRIALDDYRQGELSVRTRPAASEFLSALHEAALQLAAPPWTPAPAPSLRDDFARAALQGMLSNDLPSPEALPGETNAECCARNAYVFADAMIKERAK